MKHSLNRITNRQYLLDITLYEFTTNYSKEQAIISCQLHYDENYIKFKSHPHIKNTKADFLQQKLTIPFSIDVALVFKEIKNKRQQFLGHHSLHIEQYLKDGRWLANTLEKLDQTQSWVHFQCRIIDKNTLQESSLDQISEEDNMRKSQFSVIFIEQSQKVQRKRPLTFRAHSQYHPQNSLRQSFNIVKSFKNILLPEQFEKKLHQAEQIIYKKVLQKDIQSKLQKFNRDGKGCLKTQKIVNLQSQLSQVKKQVKLQRILIYFVILISSFFFGMIVS